MNIQQVPQLSKAPFRKCFIGQNGNKIIVADFSQIELRILAEYSQDKAFIDGFNSGNDFHVATAAMMFNVPANTIMYKENGKKIQGPNYNLRNASKCINFGLIYGRGPMSLGAQIGVSTQEAKELIIKYFKAYPKVQDWLDIAGYAAISNRCARTMSNRIRYFEFDEHSSRMRSAISREGKNTPVQGTSADITKIALYRTYLRLLDMPKIKMVNTVHDEIVAEAPIDLAEEAAYILKYEMEEAGKEFIHSVPVIVDSAAAHDWSEK